MHSENKLTLTHFAEESRLSNEYEFQPDRWKHVEKHYVSFDMVHKRNSFVQAIFSNLLFNEGILGVFDFRVWDRADLEHVFRVFVGTKGVWCHEEYFLFGYDRTSVQDARIMFLLAFLSTWSVLLVDSSKNFGIYFTHDDQIYIFSDSHDQFKNLKLICDNYF